MATPITKLRSQIAVAVRLGKPQEELDDLRRQLRTELIREHINTLANEYPPLTDEQRAELARILSPVVR